MTCRESCAQRMLPLSAMRTGKVAMSPGEDGLIGIPFPEHSSEILSNLNAQRRAGLLCDLTLTSRGARYPTHRSVMAAVSLYFRRLFGAEEGDGGGEAGRGGGGFSVCQLDCVAPDALDALLEFAYTATLTIRSSGMRDVLRGAQLLGIQCVADACREILGETGEAEGEAWGGDNRAFPSEREKEKERGIERGSRRKKDRRKMERVQQTQRQPSSPLTSPPTVPVSPSPHPSPAHDPVRSLPPTLPPSPEPEYPSPKAGQNGERKWGREPEMGSKVNGGMHWPGERLFTTNPPSLPDERLSEEEEGLGNGGAVGASSTPAGGAVLGAAGGRKRKSQTPQQCPVCQKIIHGAGKLPRHMRTHTGEKPFQCSACGVRFTRNDKLKIHMRKHTGERPYSCPHCPARFLHSYDLKNHLSLHSGARPFECPLCHKAFAREDHLQRHRKGHSCLEMRTRRPRRGAGHGEDGRGAGGGGRGHIPDQVDQCEPLALNTPRPSAYLSGGALVDGEGPGSEASQLLQEAERERSVALHALSLLGAHRFHPGLSWTGVDLRGVRAAMEGNEMEGSRSPAPGQEVWEEEEEDEMGEDDDEEEEEE